ncbi:hypothetical protein CSV61_04185 [Sporosarcina sp. P3]|uniref:hypothetical protein n=1 Tax=Sporosarcina sp. P3 TaxID=2048245 RepID=UPI000C168624|nr:hypothetical protein [Sporosarcina sp. P3]PID22847.1 hypothetical protein CSV61_04185 [Sporosarcina sp. P3]
MRKTAWILLIIMIILGIVFLGNRASQDAILSKDIHLALEQEEKQIDLTTMTSFEWDAVEVFGPYTTNEIIEDSMDIRFRGDNGGIDVLEDRFLLVFADEKNAVKTVVLSRKYGDFLIKDNKILLVE